MSPSKHEETVRWGYVFYEEDGHAPAAEFLEALPSNVRQRLLDTLDAVLQQRNPPRTYLPNRWHSMKEGGVDMSDYFEARDQHGDTNYRLFCRFDSAAARTALGAPVLVLLSGAAKPVRIAMDSTEYVTAKALWSRYNHSTRSASAVSYPPLRLPPSPKARA